MYDKNVMFDVVNNPPVDFTPGDNPSIFSGSGHEIARGAKNIWTGGERAAKQQDATIPNALGVNQYVTPTGHVAQIHDIESVAPEDLPKFEKPDAINSGKGAIMLGDFMQQAPAMALGVLNPALGFTAAAALGSGQAAQEADERGLKGNDRLAYIGITSTMDGLGGAVPGVGGIGEKAVIKYGSRFVIGGGVNLGMENVEAYSRAAILDKAGFHEQADQMRQHDLVNTLTPFILGGVFNLGGGHLDTYYARSRKGAPTEAPIDATTPDTEAPASVPPEGTQGVNTEAAESVTAEAQAPAPDVRLTRLEVKQAKSDIANSTRHLERIDAEEAAILDAAPTGSGGANRRYMESKRAELDDLAAQREKSQAIHDAAAGRLNDHYQRNINNLKQEDIDAATQAAVHDNYATESAPGLAADSASETAHIKAMDSAIDAVQNGRAVDVSAHINESHTFVTSGGLDSGVSERATLAASDLGKADAVHAAAEAHTIPDKAATSVETLPDPFEVMRQQAEGIRAEHPELASQLQEFANLAQSEHAIAAHRAGSYEVAAACALIHGA